MCETSEEKLVLERAQRRVGLLILVDLSGVKISLYYSHFRPRFQNDSVYIVQVPRFQSYLIKRVNAPNQNFHKRYSNEM